MASNGSTNRLLAVLGPVDKNTITPQFSLKDDKTDVEEKANAEKIVTQCQTQLKLLEKQTGQEAEQTRIKLKGIIKDAQVTFGLSSLPKSNQSSTLTKQTFHQPHTITLTI